MNVESGMGPINVHTSWSTKEKTHSTLHKLINSVHVVQPDFDPSRLLSAYYLATNANNFPFHTLFPGNGLQCAGKCDKPTLRVDIRDQTTLSRFQGVTKHAAQKASACRDRSWGYGECCRRGWLRPRRLGLRRGHALRIIRCCPRLRAEPVGMHPVEATLQA